MMFAPRRYFDAFVKMDSAWFFAERLLISAGQMSGRCHDGARGSYSVIPALRPSTPTSWALFDAAGIVDYLEVRAHFDAVKGMQAEIYLRGIFGIWNRQGARQTVAIPEACFVIVAIYAPPIAGPIANYSVVRAPSLISWVGAS
jgi:hypothetical protein